MNDTQLYLAIGIPSLLVILNIYQSNRLGDKVDRLFGDSSSKTDRAAGELSSKIDRVSGELSSKIDRVSGELSAKIERVAAELSAKIERLAADNHRDHLMLMRDQVALNERVAKAETRLDGK
jgi:hypothetical protein